MNVNFAPTQVPLKTGGSQAGKDAKDGGIANFDDALSARADKRAPAHPTDAEERAIWKSDSFGDRLNIHAALVGDAAAVGSDGGLGEGETAPDTLPIEDKLDGEADAVDVGFAQTDRQPQDRGSSVAALNSLLARDTLSLDAGSADEAKGQSAPLGAAGDAEEAVRAKASAREATAFILGPNQARTAAVGAEALAAGNVRSTARLGFERQDSGITRSSLTVAGGMATAAVDAPTGLSAAVTTDAVEQSAPIPERPHDDGRKPSPMRDNAARADMAADPLAGRVTVLGATSALAPAPTAPQLNITTAGLVSAIEGDPTWRAVAQDADVFQRAPGPSHGVNSLRIQLNPAELGMVTARLTTAGAQLSIEIQVETPEARQKLATDSDEIIKALRSIGFDVEKVTIQQSSSSNGPAQQGAGGREQSMSHQHTQGDGSARQQGERGPAGRSGEGGRHASGEVATDRSGSDLYI